MIMNKEKQKVMNGWLDTRGTFHIITCTHLEYAEQINETEDSMIQQGWIKVQRLNNQTRTYGIKPLVIYDKVNRRQLDYLHDPEFLNYRFQLHGHFDTIGWFEFLEQAERLV